MSLVFSAAGVVLAPTGNNPSSVAPAFPTTAPTASRKYLTVAFIAVKPDTSGITTPTGWTLLGTFTGGAGSAGIDTGPTKVAVFTRDDQTTGPNTGTQTFALTGSASVTWAYMERWEVATTEAFDAAVTGGADSTAGAAYSAVTASVAAGWLATGDRITVATVIPTDTLPTTWGTATVTAQGAGSGTVALGAATSRGLPSTSGGNDMGGQITSFTPTVTGSITAGTLTWSFTATGTTTNVAGPTVIFRVRVAAPPSAPTSAPSASIDAAGERINVTTPATLQGGATSYKLYRSGTLINSGMAANASYADINQDATLARTYTVRGTNAAGDSTDSPASASVVPKPAPPTSVALTPSSGAVNVSIPKKNYTAVYKVYRGLSPGGSRLVVHTSASQAAGGTYSWDDTGLTNGTAYDYTVAVVAETPTSRESDETATQSVTPNVPVAVTWVPIADVTTNSWVTGFGGSFLLYQEVDEYPAANDANYITNDALNNTYTAKVATLAPGETMLSLAVYLYKKAGSSSWQVLVDPGDGGGQILVQSGSLSAVDIAGTAITSNQIANINAYHALSPDGNMDILLRVTSGTTPPTEIHRMALTGTITQPGGGGGGPTPFAAFGIPL